MPMSMITRLAYGLADNQYLTRAYIRAENVRGWTVDMPAGLGSSIRHEQVTFTAEAVERLIAKVEAITGQRLPEIGRAHV